jgi:Protein of unknown function (DUF4058)
MPVHDWTRVSAGTFHHFHATWIIDLMRVLNAGLLPRDYYAMAEQIAGEVGPDVLALEARPPEGSASPSSSEGGVAIAPALPKIHFTEATEEDQYAKKRRTLVIRHSSEDRVVALLEILSPGNKASRDAIRSFTEKAAGVLRRGVHLLVIDLHPRTPRDPQGIHSVIWGQFADSTLALPPDKPLTLVSYVTEGAKRRAYIEPLAVGDALPDMPLFLTPEYYVNVPLETTYRTAFDAVPQRWRNVLEPASRR